MVVFLPPVQYGIHEIMRFVGGSPIRQAPQLQESAQSGFSCQRLLHQAVGRLEEILLITNTEISYFSQSAHYFIQGVP